MSSDICSSPTARERSAASPSSCGEPQALRRRITYVSIPFRLLLRWTADRVGGKGTPGSWTRAARGNVSARTRPDHSAGEAGLDALELALEHLAGGVARELLQEHDFARH